MRFLPLLARSGKQYWLCKSQVVCSTLLSEINMEDVATYSNIVKPTDFCYDCSYFASDLCANSAKMCRFFNLDSNYFVMQLLNCAI